MLLEMYLIIGLLISQFLEKKNIINLKAIEKYKFEFSLVLYFFLIFILKLNLNI